MWNLRQRQMAWALSWMVPVPLACALMLAAGSCAAPISQSAGAIQGVELAPEERLGVDDVFEVRVFAEPELTSIYRVAADGTIDFPLISRMNVVGLRSGDVQQVVTRKLKDGGFLKDPQVSVMVKEWNSRKVSVIGQVQKPGAVVYFPNMTIVDAIASAGGFTGMAAKNAVTLRREVRGAVESRSYRVADISEGRAPNVVVRPGDVIVVEERLF